MSQGPTHPIPEVDVVEAARLISEEGALLVDIREPDEWHKGCITGADLKPMSTVNDWYEGLPKEASVILQCQTGVRSASLTRALIEQAGFTNVFNLAGGIVAWQEAELPVEFPAG